MQFLREWEVAPVGDAGALGPSSISLPTARG
jgi:hypothetical protein